MSSIPTLKLPLIDLSELDGSKPGTGRWDSLRCQVRRALEEFGCFEALYYKMTLELHNDLFQELKELLKLPTDMKRRFVVLEKRFDGYHTNSPHAPTYEAFGMDYAPNSGSIKRLADLMWPEGNTRFCETMNTYVTRVLELDSPVRKLVLGSLGVDKYVDSLAKSIKYNLCLMRYAPPGNDESKKPDTTCYWDANFVTILHQNHVNGLEMQTKDGRWIEGWSNGRLHSPRHRVRVRGHEPRYSIGLFSSAQGTVQCPDELVDDQRPLLFKPFDAAGLSRIYKTKEGENGTSGDGYFLQNLKSRCFRSIGVLSPH